jgi:hypothetical protein
MVSDGIVPTFLTLALHGGEWSDSCPCHFTPWGKQLAFIQFIYGPSKYYLSVHLPDFVFNYHRDMKIVVSQSVDCTQWSNFNKFLMPKMPVSEIF